MQWKAKHAAYSVAERGEGEPVILLHGFTGTSKTWQHCTDMLAQHFRLYALDMPGHGRTTAEHPVTMAAFVEDLHQLLSDRGLGACHLIGYSMGGRAALAFAIQYPQFVRSLVLESASPGLAIAEARKTRQTQDAQLAAKIETEGLANFVAYWEHIPLFQSQQALPQAVQQQIRSERLSQSSKGLADSLRYMGTGVQPSYWDSLKTLQMPVLLLAGELDDKFIRIQKQMHDAIPASRTHMIEQVGHAIHVENPQKFDKVVLEFLLACT